MEERKRLKQRRIELGLTLKEVAQKVGVSEGTVSRWESGEIVNIRRDKYPKLMKTLNLRARDVDDSIDMMSRRAEMYYDDYIDALNEGFEIKSLNNNEAYLLEMYRCMNAEGQSRAIVYVSDMVSSNKYNKEVK